MKVNTALLQIDIAFGDPKANRTKVERYFHEAMKQKTDVVVLPELWTTGYDLGRLDEIADRGAEETVGFISALAKEYSVNVVGGSVAKQTANGDVTNTMLVINREGELVKEYSKAHLFRLMSEEKFLKEGNEDGNFELDGEPCAGVICYDIRFPEWIRTHMLQGSKTLYVVAEWPKPRVDHWRALLISRAIENQCYVVACNRVGSDPNNEFGGHSIIIDPWGKVVAEADDRQELVLRGEIDTSEVDTIRDRMTIYEDRRPELYKI
ncbi:carbon-nitrogen family hydrolase [Alteribacter keqinensis]|uniref:Carbon-nitrogen family hydrolase n=1 Tax=Alteribacter keqinensis TaxID=2483800 RepID=A0A3M7TR82_9BACI|nr:carbon-nitrogen family hydrolase [Alteribacter keqinensis]RNA67777.1 carbon-nitrogen family hydrolase [Alteribacter keqinensis]